MNRVRLTAFCMMPALAVLVLAGCNGEPDEVDEPEEVAWPFDLEEAGHATGGVSFEGAPPEPETLDMSSEPDCDARYDEEPVRERVKVEDGRLANALVYVRDGLEGMEFPIVGDAPVMDQLGCRYIPEVAGVQVGQPFIFRNSDGLLHNINATPELNRPFNISQPVNMDTEREFTAPEVAFPVRCDVHGWMEGFVAVFDHPYYAVSGEDGSFHLEDLPPGDYVVEAWHPELGVMEQEIAVEPNETVELSFQYEEGMLETAEVPMGEPIDPHDHPVDLAALLNGSGDGHGHGHGDGPRR